MTLVALLAALVALVWPTLVAGGWLRGSTKLSSSCSVSLNFSQPCNMMYLGLILR